MIKNINYTNKTLTQLAISLYNLNRLNNSALNSVSCFRQLTEGISTVSEKKKLLKANHACHHK